MTLHTNYEDQKVPANTVLVMGGTGIDDTIMDLLALWELADNDPKAGWAIGGIGELIAAELLAARERQKESEAR